MNLKKTMLKIKPYIKNNYKSQRIKNKLVKSNLNQILEKIIEKSPYKKKLIYRQFNNFYSKKYFTISFIDTCSNDNFDDLCKSYNITKYERDNNIKSIHHRVINQDDANIIDNNLIGCYYPDNKEIIITTHISNILTDLEITLIHEFSHFLHDYKFTTTDEDLLDFINDEFEAFFQELLLEKNVDFIRVENVSKIRILFESKYSDTIYNSFVSCIETAINNYCNNVNIMNINLSEYLNSKPDTDNNENSIFTKIKSYVRLIKLWTKHFTLHTDLHKNNLNIYIEYCRNLISNFKDRELQNKLIILFTKIDTLTNTLFNNL